MNGELDKDEYQSQCYIESFEEDLVNQLRKFRQQVKCVGSGTGGGGGS